MNNSISYEDRKQQNEYVELPVIDRLLEEHQLLKWLLESQPVTWVIGGDGVGKKTLVSKVLSHKRFHRTCIIRATGVGVDDTYGLWKQVAEQSVQHMSKSDKDEFSHWIEELNLLTKEDLEALNLLVPNLQQLIKRKTADVNVNEKHLYLKVTRTLTHLLKITFTSPTIIILEDIHLADRQSLDYLTFLLQENLFQQVQLIVVYNPEKIIIRQFNEEAIVQLKPLSLEEVKSFVQPMLTPNVATNAFIISYLYEQTCGNISKLKELLHQWHEQNILKQHPQTKEWTIYADEIAQLIPVEVTDSLQFYMQNNQFKSMNNEVLSAAAVLKTIFNAQIVSLILKQDVKSIEQILEDAVQKKILKRELYHTGFYRFSNDDIRQECLKQLSQQRLSKYHFDICFILDNYCSMSENFTIRDVLYHANESHQFFNTPTMQEQLAKWYVRGALQEKSEGNSLSYFKYMELAKQLICIDFEKYSIATIFEVYDEWAKCLFIQNRWEESETLLRCLIEQSFHSLQKAELYLQLMQIHSEQYDEKKLLTTYTMLKNLLGVKVKDRMSNYGLLFRWFKLHLKLKNKLDLQHFSSFQSSKQEVEILMKALYILSVHCYKNTRPAWFKWNLIMNELTMEHGIMELSSHSLNSYATVLTLVFKDYEEAYKWGYFALNIVEKNTDLYTQAKTLFMVCNDSWRKFEPNYLNISVEDLHNRKYTNDPWFNKHYLLVRCSLLFQYSYPIADIQIYLQEECKALGILENDIAWKQAVILDHLITNLTGITPQNSLFEGVTVYGENTLDGLTDEGKFFIKEFRHIQEYVCDYIFGNYSSAWEVVNECFKMHADSKPNLLSDSSHNYYYLLIFKEVYFSLQSTEKKKAFKKAKKCERQFKKISATSPENYLHKYRVAKAIIAYVNNDDNTFLNEMKGAYACAIKYKQIHDAAIILENIARFYVEKGQQLEAKFYLVEACENYRKWGALKKVQQLEKNYSQLLFPFYYDSIEREDHAVIVKSAQIVSQGTDLNNLLQQLLLIMLQQAEANYGAIIFGDETKLTVEAYGTTNGIKVEKINLRDAPTIVPTTLIKYVAQSKEMLVLNDVKNSMFYIIDYFDQRETTSVLCLPIIHQNKFVCVLYIENNEYSRAFTEERLSLIRLLSTQCAISIANAHLNEDNHFLKNHLEKEILEHTESLQKSMELTNEAITEMTLYAERNRIAQEIHDIIGHSLTSTILQIEAGRRLMSRNVEESAKRFKDAQDLVRHSLNEIRNSVHMLKEHQYYDVKQALADLIEETKYNMDIDIKYTIDDIPQMPQIMKKLIYHVLQEGLTNGIKHGQSKKFIFTLKFEQEKVHFTLLDEGIGNVPEQYGFGLRMMKDRVEQLNGQLNLIENKNGTGLVLQIDLPIGGKAGR